ncbi:MAG: hypothetical protein GY863_03120 [bacterium]|nr:hypothetical protein [bacterium]
MPGPVSGIKPPPAPKIQSAPAPQKSAPAAKPPTPQKSAPASGKGGNVNVLA